MAELTFREKFSDSIRFGERARIIYNLVLAIIVVINFFLSWPRSKALLTLNMAEGIFILAVFANIAYSTAYVADIFVQFSGLWKSWTRFRWVLFIVGLIFASIITRFISSGILSSI